jgi:peptidoglycan/LPS O-acetylase OafA/YrhL
MDSLFFGVAIGYAFHFHADWFASTFRRWRYALMLLGIGLLSAFVFTGTPSSFYIHTFGFSQFYLGAAALLVGALLCRISRNRLTVALATLGAYSYSIYLWHMALMYWAMPRLRDLGVSWQVRTAIYMVGAVVIGMAMAKLLELPALRYRDRRFPSRSTALAEADLHAQAEERPLRRAA